MSCPEYLRLRQRFLAAFRRWGHTESSGDALTPEMEEIKEKAVNERNEAHNRMFVHQNSCPVCNHNRRKPHLLK
jgi:hypothetical protein